LASEFYYAKHQTLKLNKMKNFMKKSILDKNGTGNKGTNGEVGKNGTLMLNLPKLKPPFPNLNPLSKHPTPP